MYTEPSADFKLTVSPDFAPSPWICSNWQRVEHVDDTMEIRLYCILQDDWCITSLFNSLFFCFISGVCGKPQQTKTHSGHLIAESGEARGFPNSISHGPIRG